MGLCPLRLHPIAGSVGLQVRLTSPNAALTLTVFVVSAEEGQRGVMPEPQDITFRLLLDAFEEFGKDRVDTTSKHD